MLKENLLEFDIIIGDKHVTFRLDEADFKRLRTFICRV
jgi:hypothetical protein